MTVCGDKIKLQVGISCQLEKKTKGKESHMERLGCITVPRKGITAFTMVIISLSTP